MKDKAATGKTILFPKISLVHQPLSIAYGLLLPCLLFLLLLPGCMPVSSSGKNFTAPLRQIRSAQDNRPWISCFLNLKDDQGPAIRLEVEAIELIGGNQSQQLTESPLTLDSTLIGNGQQFLAGVAVPPGNYQGLRLRIGNGEILKSNERDTVYINEPFTIEIPLAFELNLGSEDSRILLITWDLEDSLTDDNSLRPSLTATPPLKQLPLDLVFVSCPDIDTIFVIRSDKNWVVDSFGLKGGPTYISINPDTGRFLYILASRERTIKVIDLSTYRVINFFPVPLNDDPSFMTISPDGRSGYLLDEQSGHISRIDLTTGQIVSRILQNYQPKYTKYLNERNLLAVSLSLLQRVLLLDPETLQTVGTISTGSSPQGLAYADNQLLIAEYGDNTITIHDMDSGSQNRLTVGFGPRRLLETDNKIFVSNYKEGSLSVLLPDQLGVMQDIYGFDSPLEMAFDQSHHRLYVTDENKASLAIVDTGTNTLLKNIFLGARPFDLEIIQ